MRRHPGNDVAAAAADSGQAGAVRTRGRMLPLHVHGRGIRAARARRGAGPGRTELRFHGIASGPVPSLLRGFSAPVILECDYTPAELALLLGHDVDGFNRWEAGQQLAARAYENLRDGDAQERWMPGARRWRGCSTTTPSTTRCWPTC